MALVDSLRVLLLHFGIKVPPPAPAGFAATEEFQVQRSKSVCLSILDVINKGKNARCKTGLFKGHLFPYGVLPGHIHFPGGSYWKGQMFFPRVLRLLCPLVNKYCI